MQSLVVVEDGSFCVKTLALPSASLGLSVLNKYAFLEGCKPSHIVKMIHLVYAYKVFESLQSL